MAEYNVPIFTPIYLLHIKITNYLLMWSLVTANGISSPSYAPTRPSTLSSTRPCTLLSTRPSTLLSTRDASISSISPYPPYPQGMPYPQQPGAMGYPMYQSGQQFVVNAQPTVILTQQPLVAVQSEVTPSWGCVLCESIIGMICCLICCCIIGLLISLIAFILALVAQGSDRAIHRIAHVLSLINIICGTIGCLVVSAYIIYIMVLM